uniref:Uncharacterized protein n=1 Tax=Globisporangium ultimum (strain ATCC 200006 / CBS 805.95 / DAOM BR144) TaxID=431595 RepID=K3X9V6_GLOUD
MSDDGDDYNDDDTDSLHALRDEDEEFLDNMDDEPDDEYSGGESDVFEDDIDALMYQEQLQEKAMGLESYAIELPLNEDVLSLSSSLLSPAAKSSSMLQFAYPRYLSKLPEILHRDAVFGPDPTQYIYCNNLLLEALKKAAAKKRHEQKQQEIKARELQSLREAIALAMEPPQKKNKFSESSNSKASESNLLNGSVGLPLSSASAKADAASRRAAAAAKKKSESAPFRIAPPRKRPSKPRKKPTPGSATPAADADSSTKATETTLSTTADANDSANGGADTPEQSGGTGEGDKNGTV